MSMINALKGISGEFEIQRILGNFGSSTLLKLHKAGSFDLAQQQFVRWNRGAGKIMDGLTRRRQAEAALYGEAA